MHCVVGPYIFTLYMMLHLNVQDNNDDVKCYVATRYVGHNACTYCMLHFKKHPSKEIDDFSVILFQIYWGYICVPIIIRLEKGLTKSLQK